MITITRPTHKQANEAPIGSRLLFWTNKEEWLNGGKDNPSYIYTKKVRDIDKEGAYIWIAPYKRSYALGSPALTIDYKVILEIPEVA